MRFRNLILSSLWHYRQRALTVAFGMAIGMAVITGALVTGDSVRGGLQNLVNIRLGNVDLSIASGERYMTDSLAVRMSDELGIPATAALQLEGSVTAGGGAIRLPKIQVYGIDPAFTAVLGEGSFEAPTAESEAIISDNLATRLDVKEGDEILIRIRKPGPVPIDAPFVSDEENIVTARVVVKSIADKGSHGRFHLRNTQTAPFNIFISKRYLQPLVGLEGSSNLILMATQGKISRARAEQSLASNRTLTDAGLHLEKHPVTGEWIVRTPRVFFDLPTLSSIESLPSAKSEWFSYFVNEFSSGGRSTPYSFVSTLPGNQVAAGEVLINRWLADDLGARPGDSLTMSYFMVGPLRNLTVEKRRFVISGIVPMDDPRSDRLLMPEIPGLSDAGNCRDWETSIPIDLDKIRDKDEKYWEEFKGTPKAFINQAQAAEMWQNRFGKYTQIRFGAEMNPSTIGMGILKKLHPADIGISVREPASEGTAAATSGVDFSGLFLGLSFFLIAGGILLAILLIRLGIEGRLEQIGTLKAIGWPEKRIRQLFFWENGIVALIGTFLGILLTWIYTILIFKALNGVWNSIVLTDTLRPLFKPGTLLMGAGISILVSIGSVWLALRGFFGRKPINLVRRNAVNNTGKSKQVLSLFPAITGIGAIGLFVYGVLQIKTISPTYFFSVGILLLISLILLAILLFKYPGKGTGKNFTIRTLSRSNLLRNSNRSLSVVLLFSLGVFMVMAIGGYRKDVGGSKMNRSGGDGGFQYFLETTVPIPDNLNNPLVRAKYGLETPSEFVQMKKLEGDDASCLNLNRVSNPPLAGVPAGMLNGRFSFAATLSKENLTDPWKILDQELPGGAIPAIADQTVIQWGLGLKIGDTLEYKSETGDTVKLVLAGGLANSIFQGSLLISEKQFIRHWPSVSGTNIFLVDADKQNREAVHSEVQNIFRDYGVDLKPAAIKLAEYNAVENTYLSIFLVMGALAMLLGTIGLAVILARNLQERKEEIALLRAIGFSRLRILWLIVREYSILLVYGTLAGGLPALVSILPGLLSPAGEVSLLFLSAILLALLANGMVWIVALGWRAVRSPLSRG